eukprot:scaffold116001_cov53-Attheya_sp.AAC.1
MGWLRKGEGGGDSPAKTVASEGSGRDGFQEEPEGIEYGMQDHAKIVKKDKRSEAKLAQKAQAMKAKEKAKKAEEKAEKKAKSSTCRKCILWLLLLIAIIIALLALYWTMWREPEQAPSSAPTTSAQGHVLDKLSPHTDVDTLLDPTTPQGQSFLELVAEYENEPFEDDQLVQRHGLISFFESTTTNGQWLENDGWADYSMNECDWQFLECNDDGEVLRLEAASNELAGTLPSELCALTSLQHLDLGNQLITGTLPSCFSKLQNLIRFELDDNAVTGTVPYGLLAIPTLTHVEMYANQFDGNLDGLFALPEGFDENSETAKGSLLKLIVDRNSLTGTIPTEVGEFTKLNVLKLHDNNLTGDIPSELNELDELEVCELNGNVFTLLPDCNIACDCCDGTCV